MNDAYVIPVCEYAWWNKKIARVPTDFAIFTASRSDTTSATGSTTTAGAEATSGTAAATGTVWGSSGTARGARTNGS